MSDHIEKMRQLIAAKKQKSAEAGGTKARPEKNIADSNRRVTKQHKKGGLFDGK